MSYPKRLIEVDLPIQRISAHARREKSIRHGHISTLHIWWARRPLAACRAVLCAALWPDPADPNCPPAFRAAAVERIQAFARQVLKSQALADSTSEASFGRWNTLARDDVRLDVADPAHLNQLRYALLDFIADFANWDNSTVKEYLETSRALTQAAHEALGGAPGTGPLVVDPFAGGGAIPLEALRVGADAFASDLNPVAVLLNTVVLEYIPRHGQRLADEVRKWGQWVKEQAEKELAQYYPKDPDGATPIAYLWARTIKCEGCGAEVPLMRSLWLAQKGERSIALRLVSNPSKNCVDFEIIEKQMGKWVHQADTSREIKSPKFNGTVKRGSATCRICGFTTPVVRVRAQLKQRNGGTQDARLIAVVTTSPMSRGRSYRLPTDADLVAHETAAKELQRQALANTNELSLVPDELLDVRGIRHTWVMIYGLERWNSYYTSRQALVLCTLARWVRDAPINTTLDLQMAIRTCLALAVDKQADRCCSLCRWISQNENIGYTFGRQALGMMWDFVEAPWISSGGGWQGILDDICETIEVQWIGSLSGQSDRASATSNPLPDDTAQVFFTDPPYYDAVPYAHLSDFFYVWLRRTLRYTFPELLAHEGVPKDEEIVVDRPHELSNSTHDISYYERQLTKAFAEGRRLLAQDGIGVIVFASKTTASWEAILDAVVKAGWTITASWPIDTEREARIAALGQARLGSSVHLVMRPREFSESTVHIGRVGDWRNVLVELPQRIREWMPRLAQEGIVGADAIFACLGPALEIFSRYDRVEKADGTAIPLREYLEYVWAAVGREALNQVFKGADPTGFEEDARLTALWLWTLTAKKQPAPNGADDEIGEDLDETEVGANGKVKGGVSNGCKSPQNNGLKSPQIAA
jgi:putative DNA methylase